MKIFDFGVFADGKTNGRRSVEQLPVMKQGSWVTLRNGEITRVGQKPVVTAGDHILWTDATVRKGMIYQDNQFREKSDG